MIPSRAVILDPLESNGEFFAYGFEKSGWGKRSFFVWWAAVYTRIYTVFEIKVLFCAPAGCKDPKMVHPATCLCVIHYIYLLKSREKHAHTGCTGLNSMHPATKMCTQGAGCPLLSNTVYSECNLEILSVLPIQ